VGVSTKSPSERSGPTALKLVEDPVRAFFGTVSPNGVRVGAGERPALDPRYASDMDIVFDYDGDAWVAHLRMGANTSPVLAHLDVASRTNWDAHKLAEDLGRVQRTIYDAQAHGRKTWTGLVAIGSGFHDRCGEVMRVLHEAHHRGQEVERWESANAGSVWPFVDAIVIPGMLLKKHDLFHRRDLHADRQPVLYPFPVGGVDGLQELWPLVAARAFLAAYLRRVVAGGPWDSPAWNPADTAAILGGASVQGAWPEPWRVVTMRDDAPFELNHWTGNDAVAWQDHVLHAEDTCSHGRPYLILPRPTFSMTEGRRQRLVNLLRQDHRWFLLRDDGSRLVAELEFPVALREEMERIVQTATSLGYNAAAHQRIVKRAVPVPKTEILSIEAPKEIGFDGLRTLRELLLANLPRATWLAGLLQLDPVHRWLDDQYGKGAWSYDSKHALTKSVGNVVLFRMRETKRGDALVLLVLGDAVERLPITFD
jgi:hypothetical protein